MHVLGYLENKGTLTMHFSKDLEEPSKVQEEPY